MNTRGTRHLSKALNAGFDFFTGHHHQIRHLIHNHHDIWHFFRQKFFSFKNWLAGGIIKPGLDRAAEHFVFA